MTPSPTNNSADARNRTETTTLSRYLHSEVFDPILHTEKSAVRKYESIDRINSFLLGPQHTRKQSQGKGGPSPESHDHCLKDNLFAHIVSDVHLSIHRPKEEEYKKSRQSSQSTASTVVGIQSGIQLPIIDWARDFRKSYSLLMWVCFHENDNDDDNSSQQHEQSNYDAHNFDSSSSLSSMPYSTFDEQEPQILYRFASSTSSSKANGVQATLHKDISYYENEENAKSSDNIAVIIRIESLLPMSSKVDTYSVPSPNSFSTKRILIPNGQWTLICIQHTSPYLKKPEISVSINGVEIQKSEMAYPSLGSEVGEVMMDNYVLCNIPSRNTVVRNRKKEDEEKYITRKKMSSVLNVDKVDFAGFGLFNETIPTLLQAIICEYGPCPSADGVIPAVPPVVQSRDGIVIGTTASQISRNPREGANMLNSPKKNTVVSSGPFGMSSYRMTNASEGRGIGIPLCTGVQLTEEVSHKGHLFLQQLLSKLVLGLNGSGAFKFGDKVEISVTSNCSIGITTDTKIVGEVQAKPPKRKGAESRKSTKDTIPTFDDHNGTIAKGIGNITIFRATEQYLDMERKYSKSSSTALPVPTYELPTSNVPYLNPVPSFLSTYLSVDPISYILQPFHLALPPPGYAHSLQESFYHDSFDHLYDLVVFNDGALAAKLIDLFVTNLYLGGRMREEIIHRGSIHTLVVLLRRVLLRANRLRMMNCKQRCTTKRLWEVYSSQETPDDELQDITGQKESAPPRIPSAMIKACKSLITACCGPAAKIEKRWKRPSLAVHVRRTSDIAMTAIFGFVLDFDLWGGDPVAAASIIKECSDLYCTAGFAYQSNSPELIEKYDSGYGRLLREQISVQHFLDLIRLRFGNEVIVQNNQRSSDITEALKTLSTAFSRILYVLLKYSLKKQISQGEQDISAAIAALSDCPLGSVGAHVVLSALNDIMIFCELVPNHKFGSNELNSDQSIPGQLNYIESLLEGTNSWRPLSKEREQAAKLKHVKSEIGIRLAKNLMIGQFHDVVAPMLLSRTVFDGRRTIVENGNTSGKESSEQIEPQKKISLQKTYTLYEWKSHWITTLQIFIWVASVAHSEGHKVAYVTGNLLLQSGRAGSLNDCLSHLKKIDYVCLLVPMLPTPSSSLTPGSGENSHVIDAANRLRIIYQVMSGLVASFINKYNEIKEDGDLSKQKLPGLLMPESSIASLDAFITVIVSMILYIQDRDIESSQHVSRRRGHNTTLEKVPVRAALSGVPSLVLVTVLLENPISLLRKEYNSDGSWDFVDENSSSSSHHRSMLEDQLRKLSSLQTVIIQTTALLIAKAMVVGGGEATTLILRDTISNLNIDNTNISKPQDNDMANTLDLDRRNCLLCRLISLVLMKIVARHNKDDPWKSVEVCSATARLCDFVEEKKLLQCIQHQQIGNNGTISHDQARLLCALLDVMEAGRENTGWCQIITYNQQPNNTPRDLLKRNKLSFIEILNSPEMSKSCKYVDYETLAKTEQVYHLIDTHEDIFEIFDKNKSIHESTNPQSFSTSKLLLPILQPSFRVILGCLRDISSSAIVQYTSGNGGKSLLSIVIEELRATVMAALVGLAFPHARDLCLSTLSSLRKGIEHHEKIGDSCVAVMYRDLFSSFCNEMRVRYESERKKREVAELFSYDSQEAASSVVADSHEVERLLMGNSLIESNNKVFDSNREDNGGKVGDASVDFVVFPEGMQNSGKKTTTIGWNGYKGFGSALEKCAEILDRDDDSASKSALSILSSYLDTWDEKEVIEDEESELVELFDTNTSTQEYRAVNQGIATAADTMTSYIEFASSESNRMSDMQTHLLPSTRYNRFSYTEAHCWKSFLEVFPANESGMELFERCIADAGRDYGGRLLTVPIHPQFPRSIPKQLDHSLQIQDTSTKDDDKLLTSMSLDFDELNTLVQQGNLKIVDITKNNNGDEDNVMEEDELDESGNVLVSKPSETSVFVDLRSGKSETDPKQEEGQGKDDDLYLGFPDRESESNSISEPKNDGSFRQKEELYSVRSGIVDKINPADEEQTSSHTFFMSSFANPPNSTSSSLQGHLYHGSQDHSTGWSGLVKCYYDNCVHVKPEGNRKGTLLLTQTYLIFEYEDQTGLTEGEALAIEEMRKKSKDTDSSDKDRNEYNHIIQHYIKTAALRPKSIRWNIDELSHVYLRRYRLRDSSLEMFFLPSGGSVNGGTGLLSALSSIWLDFGSGNEGKIRRNDAANSIMELAPASTVKQWPEKKDQFMHEHLRNITLGWVKGRINNFDYILALNILAGRSFNDLCQYPVFPWVLSNYSSTEIPDLNDELNYRDLSKPMGALNPERLKEFIDRYESFDDAVIPAFMYGSHYSTSAGVVLHYLIRLHPFASLHRQLQGGHFDVADRLFSSVSRTWEMCTGQSAAEVKELTPEWYCNPSFLKNSNQFKLGTSQDGEILGDVILPPWANGSPEKFVEVLRCALESDICTKMLPSWIDLIFGRKQQGAAAVEAHNVFFYLTYYGSCDVASIEDDDLRVSTELQIAFFGQCPQQLFFRPHVSKLPKSSSRRRQTLSELLHLYDTQNCNSSQNGGELQLLFGSAPLEYWLHISAPPPGPHASIVAVRLVVPDRCLAVDALGIFHFFRFGWKASLDHHTYDEDEDVNENLFQDSGVFVAQRELPHFRSVPRLHYAAPHHRQKIISNEHFCPPAVAISKCMFNRSVLVISDGDGRGGLCFQLVDPTRGVVDGEVLVPSVHASRVSALHTDPIGFAAGIGGVPGELAIVGSEDGTATLWKFISNTNGVFPIRPRLRLGGHQGIKINAVAVSSILQICVTVSSSRCCIFGLTNGAMLSSISISDVEFSSPGFSIDQSVRTESSFVDSNAVCLCATGFITLVCKTIYLSLNDEVLRQIITLHLFSLEGVHIGSKALESWRGIPHKIVPTFDGKGILVCSGGGTSIHLVSAIQPLHFIDEWRIATDDEMHDIGVGAFDIDFGPSLSRPVVAIAGLSAGAIRIHAFKGISQWSEDISKRSTMSEAVGNALAKPAEKVKGLLGVVKGKGSKVVGLGKEIGREAVNGLLGDYFGKRMEM